MELEAVVAIAKLGSFRAAALDLDMSPTAIGNAVAGVETAPASPNVGGGGDI
jgi:DNA-binding transcriptional LysR family regulator